MQSEPIIFAKSQKSWRYVEKSKNKPKNSCVHEFVSQKSAESSYLRVKTLFPFKVRIDSSTKSSSNLIWWFWNLKKCHYWQFQMLWKCHNDRFWKSKPPNLISQYTVWKFQYFSVIQILREINFGEFRSSKTTFYAIWRTLKMVKLVNFSLQKCKKS